MDKVVIPDIFHLIVDIFRYDITSLHSYSGEMFRWEQLCRPSCNALRYEYKCFLFLVSLAKRRLATVICNHICPLVGGCPPPPLKLTMALLLACVASRHNNEDEQLDFCQLLKVEIWKEDSCFYNTDHRTINIYKTTQKNYSHIYL